jgi:bilirubin oxidase
VSLKRIVLIVLATLACIVLVVVVGAYVFTSVQQPVFVNEDLDLRNRLKVPEVLQPRMEDGEKVFDLRAQQGETGFLPGERTDTLGYNGSYIGPTIRARKGDRVRMNVSNMLPDPTTTHWHGMELPAAMDGAAHQLLTPGENWRPHWTITNEAATLWYHPHLMGKTGEQVYRGLGGMLIIDDDNSENLDLPQQYGVDDIPLIVQDRRFDEDGQLVYRDEQSDALGPTGQHGENILVNGTYAPYVDVPATHVRLRLLNASNARRYDFTVDDGRTFHQIASDGGLLESPVARTHVTLAPAERAEIVIDLTGDTEPLTLLSGPVHERNRVLRFVRTLLRAERDENQTFKIVELRPQPTTDTSGPLPQSLNTVQEIDAGEAVETRSLVLDPGSQSINGQEMDPRRLDQVVHPGDIEIWEIANRSGVFHPIHIHGMQFQILDRGGKSPEEHERGWKDTVLVQNGETVRVAIHMPQYTDPHLPYMFHCHILEHEDMGMMGQFVVVDRGTSREDVFVESELLESGDHGLLH